MTTHPLHKIIGDIVEDNKFPNCTIIKDRACGEKTQRIPIFFSIDKSNHTKYCDIDLLIIKDNKIRVIVEIEEANIKPTQICGKFLTSALSSYFIHKAFNNIPIPMDDSVSFIQILDTSKLKVDKTSKLKQWKNLEKSIINILPINDSKIRKYKLIYGDSSDFSDKNGKKRKDLITCIENALN
jgi:hypothetical protein